MELSEPATAVCLLFPLATLNQKAKITQQSELEKWWKSLEWQEKLYKLKGTRADRITAIKAFDAGRWLATKGKTREELMNLSLHNLEAGADYTDLQAKAIRSDTKTALYNIAGGISGAIAIRDWMAKDHNKLAGISSNRIPNSVYLTGGNWHRDIAMFRIPYAGMDDFNSSDLVISMGKTTKAPAGVFYGVSLKKKITEAAGDPTLINRSLKQSVENVNRSRKASPSGSKVVGTAKTIPEATKFLNKMDEIKWDYFSGIILDRKKFPVKKNQQGVSGTMTFKEMISKFEQITVPSLTQVTQKSTHLNKYESLVRHRDKSAQHSPTKALFEMKGGKSRTDQPIRDHVNSRLASTDNEYFNGIKSMLAGKPVRLNGHYLLTGAQSTEIMSEMAEELTDHIFKISLSKKLGARKSLKDYYFGFGICTQVADIKETKTRGYTVSIGHAHCYELKSILCAFNKLSRDTKTADRTKGYRFKVVEADQSETSVSIVFQIIKGLEGKGKGEVAIANCEIRYKGDLISPPNYQATITNEFKKTILDGCPPGLHHGR